MKTTSFLRSALLFTAATTGAESTPTEASGANGSPSETPTAEVATKTAKKQHTVTLFESDKDFLMDLCKEFFGPQASNPEEKRFLSTAEGFRVLMEVATDMRHGHRIKRDEKGNPVFPEGDAGDNLQPEMESFDRFAEAAAKVIEARNIGKRETKVSALEARIAELEAEIAKQKGEATAPVEA